MKKLKKKLDAEAWFCAHESLTGKSISDKQKVTLLTTYLGGEAKTWWINMTAHIQNRAAPEIMTYNNFGRAFFQMWGSMNARDCCWAKWEDTKQTGTVFSYHTALTKKEMFLDPPVTDFEWRCKFVADLKPAIYKQMLLNGFKPLDMSCKLTVEWAANMETAMLMGKGGQANALEATDTESSGKVNTVAGQGCNGGREGRGRGNRGGCGGHGRSGSGLNNDCLDPNLGRVSPKPQKDSENWKSQCSKYICCFQCGKPGHWSNSCPTKN